VFREIHTKKLDEGKETEYSKQQKEKEKEILNNLNKLTNILKAK